MALACMTQKMTSSWSVHGSNKSFKDIIENLHGQEFSHKLYEILFPCLEYRAVKTCACSMIKRKNSYLEQYSIVYSVLFWDEQVTNWDMQSSQSFKPQFVAITVNIVLSITVLIGCPIFSVRLRLSLTSSIINQTLCLKGGWSKHCHPEVLLVLVSA